MMEEGLASSDGDDVIGYRSDDENDDFSSQGHQKIPGSKSGSARQDSNDIEKPTRAREQADEAQLVRDKEKGFSSEKDLDESSETHTLANLPCHLPHLPNEIWLNILTSFGPYERCTETYDPASYGYFDLKNCGMVNKTFENLIKSSCFDAPLFRTPVLPKDEGIDATSIRLHPAFDRISHYDVDHACFYKWSETDDSKDQSFLFKDTSAAKEFATSPAVRIIRIKIKNFPKFDVRNQHGLTVLQVWRAVCRFLEKTNTRSIQRRHLWGEDDDTALATWMEIMGDHNGWTGWDRKLIDGKGRLNLYAYWFDS